MSDAGTFNLNATDVNGRLFEMLFKYVSGPSKDNIQEKQWQKAFLELLDTPGADVNAVHTSGRRLLSIAALVLYETQNEFYLQELLERKADPNSLFYFGKSAVSVFFGEVVSNESLAGMRLMLEHGANPNAEFVLHDDQGPLMKQTPMGYALEMYELEKAKLLFDFGYIVLRNHLRRLEDMSGAENLLALFEERWMEQNSLERPRELSQ